MWGQMMELWNKHCEEMRGMNRNETEDKTSSAHIQMNSDEGDTPANEHDVNNVVVLPLPSPFQLDRIQQYLQSNEQPVVTVSCGRMTGDFPIDKLPK